MFRKILLLALLTLGAAVYGKAQNVVMTQGAGAPAGGCSFIRFYINTSNGDMYNCFMGAWQLVSVGGGGVLSGSGAAGRAAFWTGVSALSSAATFTWNGSVLGIPAVTFNGATSGSATVGVAAIAGTPARINWPTTTAAGSGYLLSSDGATPQQTSWVAPTPGCATGFTQGSVIFTGAAADCAQDNDHFFYDTAKFALSLGGNDDDDDTGIFLIPDISGDPVFQMNSAAVGGHVSAFIFAHTAGAGATGDWTLANNDPGDDAFAFSLTDGTGGDGYKWFVNHGPNGAMYLNANGGNVGIGVSTGGAPGALLDVGDDFHVNTSGVASKYASITTAGLGLPVQVGVVRAVAQVAAIGTTTAFTVGAADSMYDVNFVLNCTTTSAAATVNITIGWTDTGSQAQTATLGSAIACTALGAASTGNLRLSFSALAASTITYSTAIVNTPTYDIRGAVYQVTSN